eukprot:6456036-Amphidinium_carterae.4
MNYERRARLQHGSRAKTQLSTRPLRRLLARSFAELLSTLLWPHNRFAKCVLSLGTLSPAKSVPEDELRFNAEAAEACHRRRSAVLKRTPPEDPIEDLSPAPMAGAASSSAEAVGETLLDDTSSIPCSTTETNINRDTTQVHPLAGGDGGSQLRLALGKSIITCITF